MKARQSFTEKIQAMMQRSGLSYRECCARLGRRGGLAAAEKKRRIARERERQKSMKCL